MSVVILGFGYIGAALAQRLRSHGERVVALDDFFSTPPNLGRKAAEQLGVELVEGSITDPASLDTVFQQAGEVSAAYLLAAQPSADPAAAPAELTERVNLTGPRLVFEACARHGIRRLIFGSSMRVYGRVLSGIVTEATAYGVAPDLPHLSKTYAEQLFAMLTMTSPVAVTSARLGLVYGAGPIVKTDPRFMTAPNRFCRAVATGESIQLRPGTANPDTLIHVEDAAAGLELLRKHGAAEGHVAVNLTSEVCSIRDVARLVGEVSERLGRTLQVIDQSGPATAAPVEVRSRLTELGWQPQWSLRRGIEATVHHFLGQMP